MKLQDVLTNNVFQIGVLLVGAIVGYSLLSYRVQALEKTNDENRPLVERFYVVEQTQLRSTEDIKEIKDTVKEMDQKIDRLLENRQVGSVVRTTTTPSTQIASSQPQPITVNQSTQQTQSTPMPAPAPTSVPEQTPQPSPLLPLSTILEKIL